LKKIRYICTVNSSDFTPLLQEMLHEMRRHLTKEDIRAGLPPVETLQTDVSPLYADWTTLCKKEQRQLERIAELDADIQHMEPWGDYPMARIDQFAQRGLSLKFWKSSQTQFEGHRQSWIDSYQAELVAVQAGCCYFVTVTPQGANIVLNEAQPVEVTPSPVSTLIMLQTRAKDSLRQIRLEMGDFSLQHYREVEAMLGLEDTLVLPSRRKRLWTQVRLLMRKIKLKS